MKNWYYSKINEIKYYFRLKGKNYCCPFLTLIYRFLVQFRILIPIAFLIIPEPSNLIYFLILFLYYYSVVLFGIPVSIEKYLNYRKKSTCEWGKHLKNDPNFIFSDKEIYGGVLKDKRVIKYSPKIQIINDILNSLSDIFLAFTSMIHLVELFK